MTNKSLKYLLLAVLPMMLILFSSCAHKPDLEVEKKELIALHDEQKKAHLNKNAKQFIDHFADCLILPIRVRYQDQQKIQHSNGLDHHQISCGENKPIFDLRKDSIDFFLYALHTDMRPEKIAKVAGWPESMQSNKIKALQLSGFLSNKDEEKLLPTCTIIIRESVKELFAQSENAAGENADSIKYFIL